MDTSFEQHISAGWQPVVDALRSAGLPTALEASVPGHWYFVIGDNDTDCIHVGSHAAGTTEPWEDTIDLDGPTDFYMLYRRVMRDGNLHLSEPVYTAGVDPAELISAAQTLAAADSTGFFRA